MPNLPRLSQAPFISPTNNMLLIPCFMDEVHAVSYLVLSITSNCLQLPASVFKVISLQPARLDEKGTLVARGGHPPPALATVGLKQLEIREQQQLVFPNFSLLEHTLSAVGKAHSWVCDCAAVATGCGKWLGFWISEMGISIMPWDFPSHATGLIWDTSSPGLCAPNDSLRMCHSRPQPSCTDMWDVVGPEASRGEYTSVFSVSTESSQWDCHINNKLDLT